MAKAPAKTSKARMSNIMGILRGNFDFGKAQEDTATTAAYGSSELIPAAQKTKILSGALRTINHNQRPAVSSGALMGMVQASMSKVGQDRLENRKILQLMPEVDKAARLMVASIFSPNDLSRQDISVIFDGEGLPKDTTSRLNIEITDFFQKKLNLKTSAPSWVYQYGYETGAAVFAIIPLRSFEKIQESSFIGTEAFVKDVVTPLAHDSIFGFGDSSAYAAEFEREVIGLESFGNDLVTGVTLNEKTLTGTDARHLSKEMIKAFIGQEALSLTDNPSILQATQLATEKRKRRTTKTLNDRYRQSVAEPIVNVSADRDPDGKGGVVGNPILMRLPPESVTVIHTPGDPNDHQGYLVLLDYSGNPISTVAQEEASFTPNTSNNQTNIFTQVYNAYGLNGGFGNHSNQEVMERLYSDIVSQHIRKRLGKAGYGQVEMGNLSSIYRCMFSRFMQQKQTRILFLPKDLVSYMTFEKDPNGYGVSRLDRIKFSLGIKMAVQISRVMAGIKSAMDRRKIEMHFDDNFMEQPESVYQDLIREYTNKNTMTFSIDPNVIQNQIASKSISIKSTGIPGMSDFDITNEADTRVASFDFDPAILEYLDKQIYNGLHVPPATMNSLGEDEYARSVVTTNLFFSMDVAIDQDITIANISDLLKKYARYSSEFAKEVYKLIPQLNKRKLPGNSSIDDTAEKLKEEEDTPNIPENYNLDMLIDSMTISLPRPNVAPSKAQFESLDAMITSIANMMNTLFPDDLIANDDTLRPVVAMIRAKFTATNVRSYLASSGLAGFSIPDKNFNSELKDMEELNNALRNLAAMINDKIKIAAPAEPTDPAVPGY